MMVGLGVASEALAYLREGGPNNLDQLARFLSDTVRLTGKGFEPPGGEPGSWRARGARTPC
jgi:cobaltochelatase CobN